MGLAIEGGVKGEVRRTEGLVEENEQLRGMRFKIRIAVSFGQ